MKARYVQPPMNEARLGAQWRAIQARLAPPARSAPRYAFAIAAVATMGVAVATGVALWRKEAPVAAPVAVIASGTVLESGAAESAVTLPEGSRVVLDTDSRIRLADAALTSVLIEVERGGITIDATHRDGRSFVVLAAGHEVRVVGTRFSVRIRAADVAVAVERGEVRVVAPDGSQRAVKSGESWTSAEAEGGPHALPQGEGPSAGEPPVRAPATPRAPEPSETAKALFDSAQRARADGQIAEAAQLFDKLRRTWRTDPRAALAAFELGSLRLDRLDDAPGAEEALRDALTLGSASPLRQEVEARRIEALSRMGDMQNCRAARNAYTIRYPDGVYIKAIGVYCGGR
jgi:transmembrane sensor